jgi:uncharacterized membrane protein
MLSRSFTSLASSCFLATSLSPAFGDRTGDARIIAYAQRLVTLTDWIFTAGGVVLILVGAYGMAAVAGLDLRGQTWLIWGQALLGASGVIWVVLLIPTQIAQARQARAFVGKLDPDAPAPLGLADTSGPHLLDKPKTSHRFDPPPRGGRAVEQ